MPRIAWFFGSVRMESRCPVAKRHIFMTAMEVSSMREMQGSMASPWLERIFFYFLSTYAHTWIRVNSHGTDPEICVNHLFR